MFAKTRVFVFFGFLSLSAAGLAQDAPTIADLADIQRQQMLKEQAEARAKANPTPLPQPSPPVQASQPLPAPPVAPVQEKKPPPLSMRLHAIYTNQTGELVAEVGHHGVIKQIRDGHSLDERKFQVGPSSVTVITPVPPGKKCGRNVVCTPTQKTVRIGQSF